MRQSNRQLVSSYCSVEIQVIGGVASISFSIEQFATPIDFDGVSA